MNGKTSYEILIAEKAAQLPVPDMADFIWGRIEAGLDAAAAQENASTDPKQKTPSKPARRSSVRKGIIITAAAVITVIAIWLMKKRKKNPEPDKAVPVLTEPGKENVITDSNTVILPSLKNPVQPKKEHDKITDAPGIRKIDSVNPVYDSPVRQQPQEIKNDPVIAPFNRFGPVVPDSDKTVPPPVNKLRGVKGISDSDYKIIMTKKDSAGKKN